MSPLTDQWIDAGPGEAYIVKNTLFSLFPDLKSHSVNLSFNHKSDYPFGGYRPLVEYLENKHNAPVVICNGAKQALAASFYALRKKGFKTLGARMPCWHLIPPLVKECDMKISESGYDCYLSILPNNPDGFMLSNTEISHHGEWFKNEGGAPLIHDAVYYSPIYIDNFQQKPVGDIQIFSASKSYGLSGIRIGYAVCHNNDYYKLLSDYVDMTSVGVSTLSQEYYLRLLYEVEHDKNKFPQFVSLVRDQLSEAKKIILSINSDVLDVNDVTNQCGMFGWFKKGKRLDLSKAKINVVDGVVSGFPNHIRMNLALPLDKIKEIANRLNAI
jgi:hypothetical protein